MLSKFVLLKIVEREYKAIKIESKGSKSYNLKLGSSGWSRLRRDGLHIRFLSEIMLLNKKTCLWIALIVEAADYLLAVGDPEWVRC